MGIYAIHHINRYESGHDYVAEVEAESLDEVWRLGNNIESSWIENNEVSSISEAVRTRGGARSMMVGDMIIDEYGRRYKVAAFGFDDIEEFDYSKPNY